MIVVANALSAPLKTSAFALSCPLIFLPTGRLGPSITILPFASFSGLIVHSMLGHPDYYQALLLSIGAFAGGILGARLSLDIKENKLKIIVIIVLVAAAIKLIIDSTGIF